MKKLIPFLLILSLLLAACGGAAQPVPSQPEPAKTESAPASPSPSPAEETPSLEFELPLIGDGPRCLIREERFRTTGTLKSGKGKKPARRKQ